MFLLKSTLKYHIAAFHYDEVLVVDELKRKLSSPRIVIENRAAGSENAIYDIAVGGHPTLTGSHQRSGLVEEANHHDVSRNTMGRPSARACSVASQSQMKMLHEPHGDVMFIDLCEAGPSDRIDVVEVGEQVGFPGQIQARVNRENQVLYGITIQNFTSFKRKLFWHYRMASIRHAIFLLVISLRAGLWIEHPL